MSVTGPRQSGKSTLVRKIFSEYDYINLENIDTREAALADPVGFIRDRPQRLVIDEAQLAPELFNMIQVVSDETGEPGQYLNAGIVPEMYFYRDSRGKEVDLVDLTNAPKLVEIKSSRTYRGAFSATLNELASLVPGGVPKERRYVVMRRDDDIVVGDVQVVSAESWLLRCPDVSYC